MGSHNTNCKALRNSYHCNNCSKGFMKEWARDNHQKLCLGRKEAIKNNPNSYVGGL